MKIFQKNDIRKQHPRFKPENFDKNIKLVEQLQELAKGKNCTASQLAIAWVLAQGNDMFPIPGTKRVKYLQENVESVNVKLSKEDLKKIRELLAVFPPSGFRYPDTLSVYLDQRK